MPSRRSRPKRAAAECRSFPGGESRFTAQKKAFRGQSADWWVVLVGAGRTLPLPCDLEQRRLGEVAPDKLDRQRQAARREACHHRQRRMASSHLTEVTTGLG